MQARLQRGRNLNRRRVEIGINDEHHRDAGSEQSFNMIDDMRLEIDIRRVSYEQAKLIDRHLLYCHLHENSRGRGSRRRRKEKPPHALVRLSLELQISIHAGECALVTAASDEWRIGQ